MRTSGRVMILLLLPVLATGLAGWRVAGAQSVTPKETSSRVRSFDFTPPPPQRILPNPAASRATGRPYLRTFAPADFIPRAREDFDYGSSTEDSSDEPRRPFNGMMDAGGSAGAAPSGPEPAGTDARETAAGDLNASIDRLGSSSPAPAPDADARQADGATAAGPDAGAPPSPTDASPPAGAAPPPAAGETGGGTQALDRTITSLAGLGLASAPAPGSSRPSPTGAPGPGDTQGAPVDTGADGSQSRAGQPRSASGTGGARAAAPSGNATAGTAREPASLRPGSGTGTEAGHQTGAGRGPGSDDFTALDQAIARLSTGGTTGAPGIGNTRAAPGSASGQTATGPGAAGSEARGTGGTTGRTGPAPGGTTGAPGTGNTRTAPGSASGQTATGPGAAGSEARGTGGTTGRTGPAPGSTGGTTGAPGTGNTRAAPGSASGQTATGPGAAGSEARGTGGTTGRTGPAPGGATGSPGAGNTRAAPGSASGQTTTGPGAGGSEARGTGGTTGRTGPAPGSTGGTTGAPGTGNTRAAPGSASGQTTTGAGAGGSEARGTGGTTGRTGPAPGSTGGTTGFPGAEGGSPVAGGMPGLSGEASGLTAPSGGQTAGIAGSGPGTGLPGAAGPSLPGSSPAGPPPGGTGAPEAIAAAAMPVASVLASLGEQDSAAGHGSSATAGEPPAAGPPETESAPDTAAPPSGSAWDETVSGGDLDLATAPDSVRGSAADFADPGEASPAAPGPPATAMAETGNLLPEDAAPAMTGAIPDDAPSSGAPEADTSFGTGESAPSSGGEAIAARADTAMPEGGSDGAGAADGPAPGEETAGPEEIGIPAGQSDIGAPPSGETAPGPETASDSRDQEAAPDPDISSGPAASTQPQPPNGAVDGQAVTGAAPPSQEAAPEPPAPAGTTEPPGAAPAATTVTDDGPSSPATARPDGTPGPAPSDTAAPGAPTPEAPSPSPISFAEVEQSMNRIGDLSQARADADAMAGGTLRAEDLTESRASDARAYQTLEQRTGGLENYLRDRDTAFGQLDADNVALLEKAEQDMHSSAGWAAAGASAIAGYYGLKGTLKAAAAARNPTAMALSTALDAGETLGTQLNSVYESVQADGLLGPTRPATAASPSGEPSPGPSATMAGSTSPAPEQGGAQGPAGPASPSASVAGSATPAAGLKSLQALSEFDSAVEGFEETARKPWGPTDPRAAVKARREQTTAPTPRSVVETGLGATADMMTQERALREANARGDADAAGTAALNLMATGGKNLTSLANLGARAQTARTGAPAPPGPGTTTARTMYTGATTVLAAQDAGEGYLAFQSGEYTRAAKHGTQAASRAAEVVSVIAPAGSVTRVIAGRTAGGLSGLSTAAGHLEQADAALDRGDTTTAAPETMRALGHGLSGAGQLLSGPQTRRSFGDAGGAIISYADMTRYGFEARDFMRMRETNYADSYRQNRLLQPRARQLLKRLQTSTPRPPQTGTTQP